MMLARVTITASDTTHVTEIETTSAVLAVGNVVPTWVTRTREQHSADGDVSLAVAAATELSEAIRRPIW